jgi:hypothetical protein
LTPRRGNPDSGRRRGDVRRVRDTVADALPDVAAGLVFLALAAVTGRVLTTVVRVPRANADVEQKWTKRAE